MGVFGLAVLNMVYNLTRLCPNQGMVLRAERLKPRLRAVSLMKENYVSIDVMTALCYVNLEVNA